MTQKDPQRPHTFDIHRGYLRVVVGLNREITFETEDDLKSHNCRFRSMYSMKILDHFAEELLAIGQGPGPRWRSRILNPLLQRQLEGLTDYEAQSVEEGVGSSIEEAVKFYLVQDPLDPKNTLKMMHNILYIWPVRNSLAFINRPSSEESFRRCSGNSKLLISWICGQDDWIPGRLGLVEKSVITREGLTTCYRKLIEVWQKVPGSHTLTNSVVNFRPQRGTIPVVVRSSIRMGSNPPMSFRRRPRVRMTDPPEFE